MSKESYVRGFCKAAEAAGVDPHALAKFAGEKEMLDFLGDHVSNPSEQDVTMLSGVNDEAVHNAAKNLTTGDYLKNMLKTDPRQAHMWLNIINSNRDAGAFREPMFKGYTWSDVRGNMNFNEAKKDPLAWRIGTGQYANITNLLEQAGLWDAKNNHPTLAGYGLEPPKKPIVSVSAKK